MQQSQDKMFNVRTEEGLRRALGGSTPELEAFCANFDDRTLGLPEARALVANWAQDRGESHTLRSWAMFVLSRLGDETAVRALTAIADTPFLFVGCKQGAPESRWDPSAL